MDYVNLGPTGVKVSRICLGTLAFGSKQWRKWVLEEEESRPFFRRALELGINFFDTSNSYSRGVSEQILGRALKDFGAARDKVVIGTKVFVPTGKGPNQRGLSRKHILQALDDSLRRLGTDYVDLYQVHRFDPQTPMEETLEALTYAVKSGKVLFLGGSSMYAWQFAKMLYTADKHRFSRFATMTNHYNLIYREEEREMIPLCRAESVGLLPWSPLARGLLAGNRKTATPRSVGDEFGKMMYCSEEDDRIADFVEHMAANRGVLPSQLALAWILHKPGITAPIIGVSKLHHLGEAVESLSLKLTDQEITALDSTYVPHPILEHN